MDVLVRMYACFSTFLFFQCHFAATAAQSHSRLLRRNSRPSHGGIKARLMQLQLLGGPKPTRNRNRPEMGGIWTPGAPWGPKRQKRPIIPICLWHMFFCSAARATKKQTHERLKAPGSAYLSERGGIAHAARKIRRELKKC